MARAARRTREQLRTQLDQSLVQEKPWFVELVGRWVKVRFGCRTDYQAEHRHGWAQIAVFLGASEGEVGWISASGRRSVQSFKSECVWIVPAGMLYSVHHRGITPFVVIYVKRKLLIEAGGGVDLREASLQPLIRFIEEDGLIEGLVATFRNLCWLGKSPSNSYPESAATLLAHHILSVHLAPARRERDAPDGFAPAVRRRLMEYMQGHFAESITRESLARVAGLSLWHFARLFAKSEGIPPMRFLNNLRIKKAEELLKRGGRTVLVVALDVGFCDEKQLALHFKRNHGITPGAFAAREMARARTPGKSARPAESKS